MSEDLKEALKKMVMSINKEGYFIICVSILIAILISIISSFLGYIAFILLAFVIYFFRDPERVIPDDENIIVASADGIVDKIENVNAPEEFDFGKKKFIRVSIFLNIFNVHTQRIPISGKITELKYIQGKFFNITNDKYHKDNERQLCAMKTKTDKDIIFVQIAGMIARRIVCNLKENQEVNIGDRFGCIKFGSRVDIYLPSDVELKVKVGQTMVAGESVIAILK